MDRPPPDCEYTAPGAETEALDCWEEATRRHVRDGGTIAVFCAEHSPKAREQGVVVEVMEKAPPTPMYPGQV